VIFIVLDGLDASGKSTQALRLFRFLNNSGKTVCLRFHPSDDNFLGIKAKQFLYSKGRSAHFVSAFFYMADVIRSILLYSWQKYDYLIFVRYLMGTAYLVSPFHRIAYHFFASFVPKSDLMFFLDIRPQEAYRRILQTRRKREMFESMNELRKVRAKGLSLALIGKWKIIDANRSIEEVGTEIRKKLVPF
jgi:dTMP kinase